MKSTVVFKRVPSTDSGGEDALNRVLTILGKGGVVVGDADVVSIRTSKVKSKDSWGPFDVTVKANI
jgi:hypothetical protein